MCNSILESESGVGDFVICLEIKPSCFNVYKLDRSFKISAKNLLTLSFQSMFPVEYFDILFFSNTLCFLSVLLFYNIIDSSSTICICMNGCSRGEVECQV